VKLLLSIIVFVTLVFLSWSAIGVISVLMSEVVGFRPGGLILGMLGLSSIKLSWDLTLKITKGKGQGGDKKSI